MSNFVLKPDDLYEPDVKDNVLDGIFKQYEKVIVESLISSFGLDFLIGDKHGGDVDTIHNVRKIDSDEKMSYKSNENKEKYTNKENYDSKAYHSHKNYKKKNKEVKEAKKSGRLKDSYTGNDIKRNGKSDLDHVISAKEISDDRGRVLAGLSGEDLANDKSNLEPTNPRTNRTKKADTMDVFLDKYGNEYTEKEKRKMKAKDAHARKEYEAKLTRAYYTSSNFKKDVTKAAGKVGLKMGAKQALGLVFSEIWFSVKEEFGKIKKGIDFSSFFNSIGEGIKRGVSNAKEKYKEILSKFKDGVVAGVISSLTTTICNIFFTTAKNVVKIIRQTYSSLVEALKVLFVNPDKLKFGEQMRAVAKILSVGSSIVFGSAVSEAINKTPIGQIPILGEIVQTFCGALVSGIMSCTLLHILDQNKAINKLVESLNSISFLDKELEYFQNIVIYFERYAAELMEIDIEKFKKETRIFNNAVRDLDKINSSQELNTYLKRIQQEIGFAIPWNGNLDDFMNDRSKVLVFS